MSRSRPYRLTAVLLAGLAGTALAASSMTDEAERAGIAATRPDAAAATPDPRAELAAVPAEPVRTAVEPQAAPAVEPPRWAALTPADDFGPALSYAPWDGDAEPAFSEPGAPGLPPELAAADAAALRAAIASYRQGELAAGDEAAERLSDPVARTLAEFLAIRLRPQAVGYERIAAFMAAQPDWPSQGFLRRRAEEALVASGRSQRELEAWFAARPPVTTAGRIALARIRQAQGRASEAAGLIREAWRRDDFGAETEARILSGFPDVLGEADHLLRAERFLLDEQWAAALRNAGRAGQDAIKLAKARIAVVRRDRKAQAALDAVPKALRATPSFAFSQAQFLRRKEKYVDAAKAMAGVTRDPDRLADAEAWWTERRVLARELLDEKQAKLAYEVAAGHPEGDGAPRIDGEFHAGWIALRHLADPQVALRHFTAAAQVATTPISLSRAAYWQGRAAERSKDEDVRRQADGFFAAAARHATTYYGQLAAARLGASELMLRTVEPQEPDAGDGTADWAAGRAVVMLLQAEARDLAMPLLLDIAKSEPAAQRVDALADRLAALGDARALLVLGKTAAQRGAPVDGHAFPLIGVPAIATPVSAVEKPLVYAIARQESAFDPRAVSSAGARGLMQLMPATARSTATRAGLSFELDRLTSDAAYNALLGASHLGDLVGEWRGSYILAIAAYNAGSGNVKKWIDRHGDPRDPDVDPVDWVERIPFTETRNYVQRVMENLQVYRTRLDAGARLRIEADLRRGPR